MHIKLCSREAQACALLPFRDRAINPINLKLEGDVDILKMYPHKKMKLPA